LGVVRQEPPAGLAVPADRPCPAARSGTILSRLGEQTQQGAQEAPSGTAWEGERTLGPDVEPEAESPDDLGSLGRYVVIRPIGSGGMGAVYLAYDPELDRKVALKLFRGDTSPKRRRALMMEAQAMAKLTHPNVVAVHDVGEHEQTVYIAMEFVEGVTLGEWRAKESRGWRELLERFIEAGRGLESAHAQGLIHRDFKPDNVMIAETGRAVVLDFGLARATGEVAFDSIDEEPLSGAVLTEATVGRVAGTPAYMAPEQAMAGALTPAADQFAYCVSLWEALYGQRPFEGTTYAEMLGNISAGSTRRPASRRGVPKWLKRCLLRGMRAEADDRWPSMGELLAALERGRGRWRWQVAGAVVLAVAVPMGLSAEQRLRREREHEERVAACTAEGDAILAVWNDEARARLRDGMLATQMGFAERSVETIIPWLDDYAETWRRGRTEVCLHATVEKDWTSDDNARALWCLEDRQLQLEATIDQISTSDAKSARRAVRLASYLDPAETCLDVKLLERLAAPPEALRDAIRGVRKRLIESDRLRHRGQRPEALDEAVAARTLAEEVAWPPLLASARLIEGRCLAEMGRQADARSVLMDAFFEGRAVGSREVEFRAARFLLIANGTMQRYEEALVWSRLADDAAIGKVDPGQLDEAEKHYLLSSIYRGIGDRVRRFESAQRAVELRTQTLGAAHPITAAAQVLLGEAYLERSQPEEALRLGRQAYATWLEAVGPIHLRIAAAVSLVTRAALQAGEGEEAVRYAEQQVAIAEAVAGDMLEVRRAESLYALGCAYETVRRFEDAARLFNRAAATFRAVYGPKSRQLALALIHGCGVDGKMGNHMAADSKCSEALVTMRDALEPGDPELARALEAHAQVLFQAKRYDEALAQRLEALELRESRSSTEHPSLVTPLARLGDTQAAAGRADEARRFYERALEIGDATRNPGPLIRSLYGLTELALADGDAAGALEHARRAVEFAEVGKARPTMAGRAAFALAKALAATGGASEEIERHVRRAREAFASVNEDSRVEEVDAWLANRQNYR